MNLFETLLFLFMFLPSMVDSYSYPCTNETLGLTGEKIYRSEFSDNSSVSTFLEFCYVNLGAVGEVHQPSSQKYCEAWNENGNIAVWNSQHEYDWAKTNMVDPYGTQIWVGFTKNTFFPKNINKDLTPDSWDCVGTGYSNAGDSYVGPLRYIGLDRTNISWTLDNWIDPAPTVPQANIECKNREHWCHSLDPSGFMRQRLCTYKNGLNDPFAVCRYRISYCDKPAYDTEVCSGHGKCARVSTELDPEKLPFDGIGKCECEFLYTGEFCQYTTKCNDVRQDDPLVCGGRGKCTSHNQCICNEGWYGDTCQTHVENQTECNGQDEILRGVTCFKNYSSPGMTFYEANDYCAEWGGSLVIISGSSEENFLRKRYGNNLMTGLRKLFLGFDTEDLYPCPPKDGYIWMDFESDTTYPLSKSTLIQCTSPTKFCFAITRDIYWDEMSCYDNTLPFVCSKPVYKCAGKTNQDPTQCNGRGTCQSNGICSCSNNYVGSECQFYTCDGIRYNDQSKVKPPCNGNGNCTAPNTCSCEADFGGENCEYSYCNGIIGSDSNVCYGHGSCIGKDYCICDWGYGNDFCRTQHPSIFAPMKPNDAEPYLIKDWSTLEYINPPFTDSFDGGKYYWPSLDSPPTAQYYRYNDYGPVYPMMSLFHMFRRTKTASPHPWSGTDFDNTKHLDCWQSEYWANNIWIPGKGHMISIHNKDEFMFMAAQRCRVTYGLEDVGFANKMWDVWIGLRKNFKPEVTQYKTCSGANWLGSSWTDGSANDFNDVSGPGEICGWQFGSSDDCCNQEALLDGSPSYNPDDMPGVAPKPALMRYNLHYCNGTIENDPLVCSGNGYCWEHETCSCTNTLKGVKSYVDEWCRVITCLGTNSNETSVCGSHGDCVLREEDPSDSEGRCECDEGWFGDGCNVTSCSGVYTNETGSGGGLETIVCSGHGQCYAPDECECGDGNGNYYPYFGSLCQHTYCNWYPSTDISNVCSGKGVCWPYDTCTCNSSLNVDGQFCDVFKCFEVLSDDPTVCNGRGKCIDFDVCECLFDGNEQYWGQKCEITKCFGILSNHTNITHPTNPVCSGEGVCYPYDTCQCNEEGKIGDCSVLICNGKKSSELDVCNGRGRCIKLDVCECNETFYGSDCEISTCFGILGNESDVCWGGLGMNRSTCVFTDKCVCNENYYGSYCNITSCNSILSNETTVCNSKGSCKSLDNCDCSLDTRYDPTTFCVNFLCFGKTSIDSTQCNGKGTCSGFNQCTCTTPSYYGEECLEYIPGSSEFIYDFLGNRRLIKIIYVAPVSIIEQNNYTSNVAFNCSKLFTEYKCNSSISPYFFGDNPKCKFISGNGISTTEIELEIESNAGLLKASSTYYLTFYLQDPFITLTTHQVSFSPVVDEESHGGFVIPIENNNDDPEENDDDKDKDKDKDPKEKEKEKEKEGVDSGIIIGASSGGAATLIILILLILFCCCCSCCLCICFCCCCLFCCIKIKKMTKKDVELEEDFRKDFAGKFL